MKNFKHSIVAIIAVAMISSLAAAQASGLKDSQIEREQRINAAAANQSITIAEKDMTEAVKGTAEITTEPTEAPVVEEETATEEEIAAKSFVPVGYVLVTGGALNVRETPSEEANVVDQVEVCAEVQILESTEGWYRVAYDGGKTGYVSSKAITQDRDEAEEAQKSFTNYKIAKVDLQGSSVRVRKDSSTEADIIEEIDDGTYVYVIEGKDDFIKVYYGDEYKEGYVINTALQFTGEWEEKETIATKKKEIEEAKAAAARAAEIAEQNARRAAAANNASTTEASAEESVAPAASSKGQAIVNTAKKYLGVPYVWGGTSPRGFDCSGLVQYVCRANGISVNRVAADQRNNGTYVSRDNLQPGDLVFFAKNGGRIHHVGIYVGNGNMIHAPQTGDVVKISSINTQYRISQYAGAVRVY